jgi:hypothetical protein
MAQAKAATKTEEPKPKQKLQKGTPEGDKLIRVRCMRVVDYGPTPALTRRYEVGEELTIPMHRFTDWHTPEVVVGKNGESMSFRGSFERADMPKPIDDNVAKHSEVTQELIAQNEELRKRLAAIEGKSALPDEIQVIPDNPNATGKKEEI